MSTNLGNVVGLIKGTSEPIKKYVIWAHVLNGSYPDEVVLKRYNGITSSWEPFDSAENYWLPAVISFNQTTPPASPTLGDSYLIAASGVTGTWTGHENNVAVWIGHSWKYISAKDGSVAKKKSASDVSFVFDGTDWEQIDGYDFGDGTAGQIIQYQSGSWVKTTVLQDVSGASFLNLTTKTFLTDFNSNGVLSFSNGKGIDTTSTGGSDVLNIGTSNADVINIGYSGSVVNIIGTLAYQNVTNYTVKDKLITLNKGGSVASAVSSGFELEENAIITGWFTTDGTRNGWEFKAPGISSKLTLDLSLLDSDRILQAPNASGIIATTANLSDYVPLVGDSTITGALTMTNLRINGTQDDGTGGTIDGGVRVQRVISSNPGGVVSQHTFVSYTDYRIAGGSSCAFDARDILNSAGADNFGHLIGFQWRGGFNGSGIVDEIIGFGDYTQVNSGTVTALHGYISNPNINSGAIVGNRFGVRITDVSGSGTISGGNYGIYINDLTRGASNWAIYVDGTTKSYFGGTITGATLGSAMLKAVSGIITPAVAGTDYLDSSTGVTTVNGASGAITNVALTTGTLAQFAATTSLQLKTLISDETGSGALVFGTSPTFTTDITTPLINIPSTGTGFDIYNTVDQTVNYERLRIYKTSNIFRFESQVGGSGTMRSLQFVGPSATCIMRSNSVVGSLNLTATLTGNGVSSFGIIGNSTASSGLNNGISWLQTINQTSTAGYRGLWLSPFEQAVGTGSRLLIDVGTNSLADGAGTHTSMFKVDATGTITIPNSATGLRLYNTTDEVTNTEYMQFDKSGNNFRISTFNSGSGSIRNLVLTGGARTFSIGNSNLTGFFNFNGATATANISALGISGAWTSSAGVNNGYSFLQTINQTSTAGYRALWLSPFEQATGSGVKYLIDAGVNSAADGGGTHTSKFSVDNSGNLTASGSVAFSGNFQTNTASPFSSNLATIFNSSTGTNASTTQAELLFGGASTVFGRVFERGNTNFLPTAGASYASHIIGTPLVTVAATGSHALFANLVINPVSVTAGAGTLSNTATLFVNGAATGGLANYALWIAGTSRFDNNILTFGGTRNIGSGDANAVNLVTNNAQRLQISAGGTFSFADGSGFGFGSSTGNMLATSNTQKIAFWGATPIIQPSGANQALLTDSTTGTASFTLVDVGIAFSQANINNNFASLARTVNELRNVLTNTGLMKGSA